MPSASDASASGQRFSRACSMPRSIAGAASVGSLATSFSRIGRAPRRSPASSEPQGFGKLLLGRGRDRGRAAAQRRGRLFVLPALLRRARRPARPAAAARPAAGNSSTADVFLRLDLLAEARGLDLGEDRIALADPFVVDALGGVARIQLVHLGRLLFERESLFFEQEVVLLEFLGVEVGRALGLHEVGGEAAVQARPSRRSRPSSLRRRRSRSPAGSRRAPAPSPPSCRRASA